MKKYLIILLISITVAGAYAQQLKILGGPTISNYTEKRPFYYDIIIHEPSFLRSPFQNSKTGFTAGIGFEFPLNKIIAIECDALYFQRGSFFEYSYIITSWDTEDVEWEFTKEEIYNMKGIGFPVLVKARFLPHPFPYIIGGCELSLIQSHSRITEQTLNAEYLRTSHEDIKEYTKEVDLGLVFGIGFEIKVSKVLFFLEGRYNLGQRNLFTEPPPRIKTTALQIIAGFKFI